MTQPPAAEMRDLELELADSIRRRQDRNGDPRAGLLTLTHSMQTSLDEQFDVDCTILDLFAYRATESIFEWRSDPRWTESDLPHALATMTADWRVIMKHKWTGRRFTSLIAFRSRLLQFSLLFTNRFFPDIIWTTPESLADIHERTIARGTYWQEKNSHSPAIRDVFDSDNEFPLTQQTLAQNSRDVATKLGFREGEDESSTDGIVVPSLMVLLTIFMEMTAARMGVEDDWRPSKGWLDIAGQFMLQAVLEEYLRNGAAGPEAFNTAFAFGCPGVSAEDDESPDIRTMRRIFCSQSDESENEQVHGWAKMRRTYINFLLPESPDNMSFVQAMESAQAKFPYPAFEARVLEFLRNMHDGVDKPDIVQVEQGRITIHGVELSDEESSEMIGRMQLHLDD